METKYLNRNIKKLITNKIFGGSLIKPESGNKKEITNENARGTASRA
jgi:hypothetical protein